MSNRHYDSRNPWNSGMWSGGQWYPYKSQEEMGSTKAEAVARQQQASGFGSGDDLEELPPPRKDIPAADRELLELAARAIGARFEEVDGEGYGNLHFEDGTIVHAWNSLLFSGDTFELQVRLRMDVRIGEQNHTITVGWGSGLRCVEEVFDAGEAEYAATRRAVTRAAAEIGKAMP